MRDIVALTAPLVGPVADAGDGAEYTVYGPRPGLSDGVDGVGAEEPGTPRLNEGRFGLVGSQGRCRRRWSRRGPPPPPRCRRPSRRRECGRTPPPAGVDAEVARPEAVTEGPGRRRETEIKSPPLPHVVPGTGVEDVPRRGTSDRPPHGQTESSPAPGPALLAEIVSGLAGDYSGDGWGSSVRGGTREKLSGFIKK